MTELLTRGRLGDLISTYHQGAQWVAVITAPVALTIAVFAEGVVWLWSGDASLARHVSPIVVPLMIGTLLNGFMYMPLQVQLAFGWPELMVKINGVAVSLLVPALFVVVPAYGAVGAAWIWVVLNVGYILIGIQLMHRHILRGEKLAWYRDDLGAPVFGSIAVVLAMTLVEPHGASRLGWLVFFAATTAVAGLAALLLASRVRPTVLGALKVVRHAT